MDNHTLYRRIVTGALILLAPVFAYFVFSIDADSRLEGEVRKLKAQGIRCRAADIAAAHHPSPKTVTDEFTRIAEAIGKLPLPEAEQPKNRELLDQADAFLAAHPELVFPRDFSRGLWNVELPELALIRSWMKRNHQRINQMLTEGKAEEAALLFDRSAALRDYGLAEPILISFLVGVSIESLRQQPLVEAAEAGRIDRFGSPTLHRWLESLVPLEKREQPAHPLTIDTALAGWRDLADDPAPLGNPFPITVLPGFPSWMSGMPLPRPVRRLDVAKNVDWMLRCRQAASLDHLPKEYEALDKEIADLPGWRNITRALTPGLTQVLKRACDEYGRYRTLRTGLAVELFFRERGRLPETLEELVPEFLPEVPVNPFTQKPLQYEKGKLARLDNQKQTIEFQGYRIYGGGNPDDRETDPPRPDQAPRIPVWNRAFPAKEP